MRDKKVHVKEWYQNPGSDEARSLGCICPVLDNAHGKGYLGGLSGAFGGAIFVVTVGCKLHHPVGADIAKAKYGKKRPKKQAR